MIVGRDMFEMAAALARRPVESVTALGDAMLAHSARDSFDPQPTGRQAASASLNPEGIPIELAITASS